MAILVEFFGLPGCGKTTVIEKIKEMERYKGDSIANINDAIKEYKNCSLVKKIKSISVRTIWNYIMYYKDLEKSDMRKWYFYWIPIKESLIYSFCKKYSKYEYVFIDHGIVQNIVSLQCGKLISNKDMKHIGKILKAETKPNVFFHCIINSDVANERMIKRNRINRGRLDQTNDLSSRRDMFNKESDNFDMIVNEMRSNLKFDNIVDISMEKSVDNIIMEIINMLDDMESTEYETNK